MYLLPYRRSWAAAFPADHVQASGLRVSVGAPRNGGEEPFLFFFFWLRRIMDGGEEERNLLTVATQHLLSIGGCPALLAEFVWRRDVSLGRRALKTEPPVEAGVLQRSKKNKSNLWLEVAQAEGRKHSVFFLSVAARGQCATWLPQ